MSRILIVDDSSDLLNVLKWSLQRKGFSCSTAYYKTGMFYQLSEFLPSLILLDINLNGEDGRKICLEIKENAATKNIPIILCSAMHDLLNNFQACKADDFLEKPFEINNAVKKIERLLNN